MTTWTIDISNHQGSFDIARAVREGYSAVWMKATEGVTFHDRMFDQFARQTLATTAIPGAYHFLRAGDGRAQCDAFYQAIRSHGGPDGWLTACDNEADASWSTTRAFFSRWRELAGDHPMFMYSSNWWWESRGWNGASLTPYLWDSRYVGGSGVAGSVLFDRVPGSWWTPRYGGWSEVTVLQFTASALVAGRTPVDVSAFRGTVGDLRRLAGGESGGTMEQNELVRDETGNPGRDIGNVIADLERGRNWGITPIGEGGAGVDVPAPGSPLDVMLRHAMGPAGMVVLSPEDRQAIVDGVVAGIAPMFAPLDRLVEQIAAAGDVLARLGDVGQAPEGDAGA